MKSKQNRSDNNKRSLSIIIPVVNEERNIKNLVERIFNSLKAKQYKFEIIFIDDHSTDGTTKIIQSLAKTYPIRLYSKQGKKGKAFSLLEGFSYAKYDLIAIIDADLQYPPEAIPALAEKISDSVGVIVAQRKFGKINLVRKIISYGFSFVFVRLLHGIRQDVQSGLKVFKKEIIKRITLSPGPWSFDLEFLLKAKHLGYRSENYEIVFEKRLQGKAKIPLFQASWEIGISAIKLLFLEPPVIHFKPDKEKDKGKGFHYQGVEFVHHSNLPHSESAFKTVTMKQKLTLLSLALIILIGFIVNWLISAIIIIAFITFVYFVDIVLNLFLVIRSFTKKPEILIDKKETAQLNDLELPRYTILCPLYQEWEVLPQFVTAMSRLDYPKEKLQVLLLLEEDDKETIRHAQSYDLPNYFEVVVVPDSLP